MISIIDGPGSKNFKPILFKGNIDFASLKKAQISRNMQDALSKAPCGESVSWGIPFQINNPILIQESKEPVTINIDIYSKWILFLHTSDKYEPKVDISKMQLSHLKGLGSLGEHACNYYIVYNDNTEEKIEIKRRFQIGNVQRKWGQNCFQAVSFLKPYPIRPHHEQTHATWGRSQTRGTISDVQPWVNWIYAWENPYPDKQIKHIRFEAVNGVVLISAISAGNADSNPVRWKTRKKAVFTLPKGMAFNPTLDKKGLLSQLKLDMGQVISATVRPKYPNTGWEETSHHLIPELSENEILVEYTAHENANFHLEGGITIPVSNLEKNTNEIQELKVIIPAMQRVTITVTEKGESLPVPVRLHIHGESGEYLPPIDHHRIPNNAWFEDYGAENVVDGIHYSAYVNGITVVDLPVGNVYMEITKGYEIKPIHKVFNIEKSTENISIELEHLLPWRINNWVSADTHVHFLSPQTALLEGSAEGVNVVNLLASQWGELMTNVGDFDGKTTVGSRGNGGDGEYLVRVGTENRQHVLGHISLIGYNGNIITPMTTGGSLESALGDPVGNLLTEWARQCRKQEGITVIPHYPNPRLESAACIIGKDIDAIEFKGESIDPYAIIDWYRYLNCGYMTACVGGTDKMGANVSVGKIRTYAQIDKNEEFTYDAWKEAIRKMRTFTTVGPLMEVSVEDKPLGSTINMKKTGGTVSIVWKVASVTMPMTKVELLKNGEIIESDSVETERGEGQWSLKVDSSCWIAVLIKGYTPKKPEEEIIAAHSSPVRIDVEASRIFAKADAMTILEQIEGSIAWIDTVGTRAEEKRIKEMQIILTSAHRELHNKMHQNGVFHDHNIVNDHKEHY